ncbi:MAG: hypothetical protein ACRDJW_19515 [Thermomicrobiales bacterium]
MEGSHFDELTRTLGRAGTRRGMLRGLAAGLAGIVMLQRPIAAARPPRKPLGSACARATECVSFLCVDGVCCAGPCTGQCEACTAQGVCAPVTGAPLGTRTACPGSGPCAASCDGQTTSHCANFPDGETACGASTCSDGWQTFYACGGGGTCHPTTTNCGLFACNQESTACLTSCTSNEDCVGAAFCSASGDCQGDKGLGEPCAGPDECQQGYCAGGVCCNDACDGACRSCTLPGAVGFCSLVPAGGPCGDGGMCCDEGCVETDTDPFNCGGCGVRCRVAELCSNGECVCPGFPTCGTGSGACCNVDGNPLAFQCVCAPSAAVDPTTCDFVALDQCPAGSTLCAGPTGTCGLGETSSCCPAGTTCDTATGTCFL